MDVISLVVGVLGASGFWSFVMVQFEKKNNSNKLMVGLAHDRIVFLGRKYLERGWITVDEYENLHDYLYKPYKDSGGNGTAELVMNRIAQLEIVKGPPPPEVVYSCKDCSNFDKRDEGENNET